MWPSLRVIEDCDQLQVAVSQRNYRVAGSAARVTTTDPGEEAVFTRESIDRRIEIFDGDLHMIELQSRAARAGAALAEAQRVATRSRAECGAVWNEWCCVHFASTASYAKSAAEYLCCRRPSWSGDGAERQRRRPLSEPAAAGSSDLVRQSRSPPTCPHSRASRAGA
jgi:hypothetical protein